MSSIAIECARIGRDAQSRRNSFDKHLLLSAAAIALIASPAAYANPAGGAVTTGSASISTASNKTSVNQKSEDVVIDWSSFNVGAGQTTQFVQPNANALAVNRIGGASASQILGTLDANGRIVLINGNGLIIGKGAQVNVGSLIATSTDGSDSDLLSGKFTQAGKQNASVVNNGTITAASGGMVALVAPNVTNTGTVNAKLGTVALGAANKFTVDFSGDGLVSFAAQGDVNARASAINSGLLSGANVSMTAHAANGIATGIVNMSGIITAQGVQNIGGTIYLDAGNGTLTTTGTLNAAGATGGGHIETSGHVANISGHITAGQGGQWKVDPEDLTIDFSAATTIDGALDGGTSVLEQTTSGAASGTGNQTAGAGDITVASALSWSSTATLTLDSYYSINIAAPITISGAGGLTLITNDNGGSGGNYFFNNGADVAFTDVVGGATQGSLTINGQGFTLANSIAQLKTDVANFSGSGFYALANSYDASGDNGGTPYTSVVIGDLFKGIVEGLGNTISNLSIDSDSTSQVGLFSLVAGGTVRDLGLLDVDIVATDSGNSGFSVGAFVGANVGGTLLNDWATGTISGGSGPNDFFGGLVGYNVATIENSYAAVAVTNSTPGAQLGGLAGFNGGTISGTYATGTITGGGGGTAGGLVGISSGTISQSYATGVVIAGTFGGLVGGDTGPSGDITSSYWDLQTSGISNPSQGAGNVGNDSGITGETTTALQAGLPSGFSGSVWAIVPDVSYPYLQWQFNGTPQVVAGFTVGSNGKTDVSGLDVALLVNGENVTPAVDMTSGANGYYYVLLAPGTISNTGSPVFAYLTNGTPGNAYVGNALDGDGALEIEEGQLRVKSGASSVTGLFRALNTAVDSNTGADFLYTSSSGIASNSNLFLDDSAANFNINSALDVGTGTLWLYDSQGAISESGGGTITAGALRGTTKNGVTLNGANEIAALGGFTNTGSGGFALTDGETLTVRGGLNAGTGGISLTTTNGGNISLDGDLTTGGTLTLTSAGSIGQDALSSIITAGTLTGSSSGVTRLQGANAITDLADFSNTSGNLYFTNAQMLTVTGTVASANNLSLETTTGDLVDNSALHANTMMLVSSLGEVTGTGDVNAGVLNVSADTGIDLDGTSNNIKHVKTDTTNSGPNVINTQDTAD